MDEEASPTRMVPGTADPVTTAGVTDDPAGGWRPCRSSGWVHLSFECRWRQRDVDSRKGRADCRPAAVVTTYADNHPSGPLHDATSSDQWFNEGQFAYTEPRSSYRGTCAVEAPLRHKSPATGFYFVYLGNILEVTPTTIWPSELRPALTRSLPGPAATCPVAQMSAARPGAFDADVPRPGSDG